MSCFEPKKLDRLNDPRRGKDLPIDVIVEEAGIKELKTMIDLGAGTGFFSRKFADRFPACVIYACDISDVMIDWMQENISGYENIKPMKIEDGRIPLDAESIQLILIMNVYHEFTDPLLVLKECNRLLELDKHIIISDWKRECSEHGPAIEKRKDPEQVIEKLQKAGFDVINSDSSAKRNFLIIAKKKR